MTRLYAVSLYESLMQTEAGEGGWKVAIRVCDAGQWVQVSDAQ